MRVPLLAGGRSKSFTFDFDQGSLASIDASNLAAIRIVPRVMQPGSSQWYWWALRARGLGGKTPIFNIAKANYFGGPNANSRYAVWATSPDTDTWHEFDNVTIGASDFTVSNNTPFPNGDIFISMMPMYPFSRTQRKVAVWSANPYVKETVSSVNKIVGWSTPRAAWDRSVGVLPYYGFLIQKTSAHTKNKFILTSRQHPSECNGGFALEGAVDWLLGGSVAAEDLLRWCDFYVYPCLNPQGVACGYSRTNPQLPTDEHNIWNSPGTSEDIDIINAAISADTSDAITGLIDFHGYASPASGFFDINDIDLPILVALNNAQKVNDPNMGLMEEVLPNCLHTRAEAVWGAIPGLGVVIEQGNLKTRYVSDWLVSGQATMKAINSIMFAGWLSNPVVGSRDFNVTTDFIAWDSIATVAPGTGYTFSMWLNLDRTNAYQTPFMIVASDGTQGLYVSQPGSIVSRSLGFLIEGSANPLYKTSAANTIPTSGWFHALVTWNGVFTSYAGIHIYINGVEVSYTGNQVGTGTPHTLSGKWVIGQNGIDDTLCVNGRIAEVAVWDRIVSSTEIAALAARYPASNYPTNLKFYFPGNSDDLHDAITNVLGVANGTTSVTGPGYGPSIIRA